MVLLLFITLSRRCLIVDELDVLLLDTMVTSTVGSSLWSTSLEGLRPRGIFFIRDIDAHRVCSIAVIILHLLVLRVL